MLLFLHARLYQKRYNKNIGICLIKIAFTVQLILITMFHRDQVHRSEMPVAINLETLVIIVAITGVTTLLSLLQVLITIAKLFQWSRLFKRLMLRSLVSPVNLTDLTNFIAILYGPLMLVFILINDYSIHKDFRLKSSNDRSLAPPADGQLSSKSAIIRDRSTNLDHLHHGRFEFAAIRLNNVQCQVRRHANVA